MNRPLAAPASGPSVAAAIPYIAVIMTAVASGVLVSWWVAAAVAVIALILLSRPLDPVVATVITASAASFVNNEGGRLTRDFSIVSALACYAIVCFIAWGFLKRWALPGSGLTWAILLLGAVTLIGVLKGVLAGNSIRYLGLELLPLMSLGVAIALGGLRLTSRQLQYALTVFCVVGTAHVGLAIFSYAVNRVRTGGLYFTPFPAIMSLLTLSLLLREPRTKARVVLLLLTCGFLLHQLISFARGYWLGLLVAVPYVCVAYARFGVGARERWLHVGRTLLAIGSIVVVGTVLAGFAFDWSDLPALIGTRFASSVGTTQSSETASNVARLIEYWATVQHIARAPWLGYGLGYTLHVREAVFGTVTSQWYVHQTYLWIWLKLGVFGLVALAATLWAAIRTGTRHAARTTGPEAAWASAAAAGTIHMAVVGMTNFNLAQVNGTVLMAFLWGVALSYSRSSSAGYRFVWRRSPTRHLREPAL